MDESSLHSAAYDTIMYSTHCYASQIFYLLPLLWTFGREVIRNERPEVTDSLLNLLRNNLQKKHVQKNMVPSIWCSTRWSWFLREALFFWDLPFLPNCINVNLWPLQIRQQGVFQISLETTANNKWLPLYSPMCGLCIPAWEPNTKWKELQVKGHAAFPPQVTIQSLDHQWPVNQKMNKKWTRGTNRSWLNRFFFLLQALLAQTVVVICVWC